MQGSESVEIKLLLVDDNQETTYLLKRAIERGFSDRQTSWIVEFAANWDEAVEIFHAFRPHLALIDVNLDDDDRGLDDNDRGYNRPRDVLYIDTWDGRHLARELLSMDDNLGIILMSGSYLTSAEVIKGLNLGSDDYILKPFHFDELQARLLALYRRVAKKEPVKSLINSFGSYHLCKDEHRFWFESNNRLEEIELTPTEFHIMQVLMQNGKTTITTRDILMSRIWGEDDHYSNDSLSTHIHTLRSKLEKHKCPKIIHTVRGIGYVLKSSENL
jgi:two-component system, OmpR family, response regulator MprA